MSDSLYTAMLLLGPTGAGKTPFGRQLETQHLWQRDYFHLDFGEKLREAVAGRYGEYFSPDELQIIKDVLESNKLLEDKDYPIAEKIIKMFARQKNIDPSVEVIILNGFPRNIYQAKALSNLVDVKMVLHFSADAQTIMERITENIAGDRTGREDDSIEEIERKLIIFQQQTLPLIEYYKELDKNVLEIQVEPETMPLWIIQSLNSMKSLV